MVLTIGPELETALTTHAQKQGVTPEVIAVNALRERFLVPVHRIEPRDEWERGLRAAATDCGVALSDEAVSSEGLYD